MRCASEVLLDEVLLECRLVERCPGSGSSGKPYLAGAVAALASPAFRARARAVEGTAKLSAKRLRRAKTAESTVKDLQAELDEVKEESDGDEDDMDVDEGEDARQSSRRDARGRYKALPNKVRVLIWAQLARHVPPSAINANISDVIGALGPEEESPPSQRRVEAGIADTVERMQPHDAPAFDEALVGKRLEVLWRYWEKGANGEARQQHLIWATGRVMRIADGLTNTRSARARKILPAGALLWAWDADPEFDESAGEQWLILLPKKWNKQQVYSWRFDPRELGAAEAREADPRRKRARADAYDGQ